MNRPTLAVSRFVCSRRLIVQGGAAVLAIFAVATTALASDWPQFRGPDRTGVSKETGLLKTWPAGGPKRAWKATNLGEGHAAPSVANGRIYGMGRRGNDEVVWALDEKKGTELWCVKIADGITLDGSQGGHGPRGTPTIDGDRLYTLGVSGELVCLSTSDGKSRWHKNLVSDFGGHVPTWGYSESPLLDGEKVIATPGGGASTIVALNKMTGAVIWKSQVPSGNKAAYASCIAADIDGQREYIQFLGGGVVGVAAGERRT